MTKPGMVNPKNLSPAEKLAKNPKAYKDFLGSLSDAELRHLDYLWRGFWARPKQLMPELDATWNIWLMMAGRGFGKTRAGAEAIRELVMDHGYRYIGLIARTTADARDVMVEGESGILNVFPDSLRPQYKPSTRKIIFPNGAVAHTYSSEKPDQLRGPQHDAIWCDELAAWHFMSAWDNAQFGLRLGENPITIVTTTPRPIPAIQDLVSEHRDDVRVVTGSTYENMSNLASTFVSYLMRQYEGTTLGRQEIAAEILSDVEGALWKLKNIEANRVTSSGNLRRIVVAVDPPASTAECGIIVAGVSDGIGYVISDESEGNSPRPSVWAEKVIQAYERYSADVIIAESNNGGEMVAHTIRSVSQNDVPVSLVTASRGKHARAEPVSALYEQGRVKHVGAFPALEDQMTTWEPGDKSPDRLDALVWAITELMVNYGGRNYPIVKQKRSRRSGNFEILRNAR